MKNYLEEIERNNLFVSKNLEKLKNRKILLRIDTNSSIKDGKLDLDSFKLSIFSSVLKEYVRCGALPILITHQGRKGKDDFVANLKPLAERMEELTGIKVNYIDEIAGKKVESSLKDLKSGEALMLRNVRDYPDETECKTLDEMLNSTLTIFFKKKVDFFVNDALSVCHRNHLSVIAFPRILPYFFGLQLEKELRILYELIESMKNGKGIIFFVGGKKLNKLNYFENILNHPKTKFYTGGLIGQCIAYAAGVKFNQENKKLLGKTNVEKAKILLRKFKGRILYPVDFILDSGEVVSKDELYKSHGIIMDIGPETLDFYSKKEEYFFVFSGTMGVFEKGFDSTLKLFKRLASKKSIILGGHSSTAIFQDKPTYKKLIKKGGKILTSGGAALVLLAGEKMPGLEIT